MSAVKLSKRVIDALSATSRTKVHYDPDLKGFGVRITSTGYKAWIVEYRPGGGGRNVSTTRMSLGSVSTLTPDEARRRAREILAEVRLGGDPARERSENRRAQTVAQFVAGFIERHVRVKLKGSTTASYEDLLNRLVVTGLGSTRMTAVTQKQVADLHRKVGQNSPGSANKMLAVISSMFGFAALEGVVAKGTNPTQGIERFPETAMERYLTTEEIERIGEAIREGETVGIPWQDRDTSNNPKAKHGRKAEDRISLLDQHAAAAMRLLLLTGARSGEILNLRWSDVDFERALLHLPDSKTGKKRIVLNAPALAVLAALPRIGQYVIPGRDPDKPRTAFRRSWKAVLRRAGVSDVRVHDLRHTHASFGVNAGMGLAVVGKLLGHTQVATTQRYAHLADDPVRKASERIGTRLSAALEGKPFKVKRGAKA
jgi:integrase